MKRVKANSMVLLALLLVCSTFTCTWAQETQREKNRSTQPTVTGGTGLFTVYDSSTLKRSEFNVGLFANNFDRDPGNVDINQLILNVGIGLTNRIEFFASSVFKQQLTSPLALRNELSGYGLPQVVFPGRTTGPVVTGPGSSAGAPFITYPGFPTTGASVGGVLPGLPQTANGFGANVISPFPTGALNGTVPGYLNDFPFYGRGTYTGGNTTLGLKYRFTNPDSRVGFALVGFADIPTSTTRSVFRGEGGGIVSGSGAGTPDYGVIAAVTPRFGLVSVNLNLGAVKTGDPNLLGIKYLDRRNKAIASVGVDIPFNDRFQAISELTSTTYFGSGTPNLNPVNPLDLTVGARFVPFGNTHKVFFSFGGAYRRFLNESNERRDGGDVNGFVGNLVIGYRKVEPPDPCKGNVPPTVTVSADKMAVKEKTSDTVTLTAVGKDDDLKDATLTYSWSATSGVVNGSGSTATWNPGSAAPGDVTITVTANDSCSHSASASANVKVEKVNTCPTVSVSANPSSIREGSDTPFSLSANGNDPDGDNLTYTWTASTGTIEGSGSSVTLNTKGVSAGQIKVSVTVNDGICDGSDSTSVEVIAPPPPPPVYTTSCGGTMFKRNISRVDNQCKALLDSIADRLKADPTAVCVLDGHSDKGEKAGTAQARADKAKAYLIEKGIDGNRVETRSFDDTRPDPSGDPMMNSRVMIHVIPEGAHRPE